MLYVATAKSLGQVADVGGLSPIDQVVIFYKETDTCKIGEMTGLVGLPCKVQFFEMADRDDMLIQLGGLFVSTDDELVYLDSSIPVPKKYADRVSLDGKQKPKKPSRRTTKKSDSTKSVKKADSEEKLEEKPEADGFANAMNLPISDPGTGVSVGSEDDSSKKANPVNP